METKMTVIVDNVPYGELAGEWGLSILVEYDGKKILVDAGASPLFAGTWKSWARHGGRGLRGAEPCPL